MNKQAKKIYATLIVLIGAVIAIAFESELDSSSKKEAIAQHEVTAITGSEKKYIAKFEDYPSGPIYEGPVAQLANKHDDLRTYHAASIAEQPIVFASEYVISTVGCGTGCVDQSLLSKRTGKLLATFAGEGGPRIKEVRPTSRLVITAGRDDNSQDNPHYYYYFYVLEDESLKQIAKVKTTLPECEGWSFCDIDTPY